MDTFMNGRNELMGAILTDCASGSPNVKKLTCNNNTISIATIRNNSISDCLCPDIPFACMFTSCAIIDVINCINLLRTSTYKKGIGLLMRPSRLRRK